MCENKLHKELTDIVYTKKGINEVLTDLILASKYYKDTINPNQPLVLSLLDKITVRTPKSLADLLFPESFTITDNGWTFYDRFGNLLAHDGKWTWMRLQKNWKEPGVTTPLKEILLERGWLQ